MSETRKIHKVLRSKPTIEGAGVHLRRGFGFGGVPMFDPFLLLDDNKQASVLYIKKAPPVLGEPLAAK